MGAQVGGRITIDSNHVGGGQRCGEIVEVVASPAKHYRVRWDDGHETTFFPSSDATVAPATPVGHPAAGRRQES